MSNQTHRHATLVWKVVKSEIYIHTHRPRIHTTDHGAHANARNGNSLLKTMNLENAARRAYNSVCICSMQYRCILLLFFISMYALCSRSSNLQSFLQSQSAVWLFFVRCAHRPGVYRQIYMLCVYIYIRLLRNESWSPVAVARSQAQRKLTKTISQRRMTSEEISWYVGW